MSLKNITKDDIARKLYEVTNKVLLKTRLEDWSGSPNSTINIKIPESLLDYFKEINKLSTIPNTGELFKNEVMQDLIILGIQNIALKKQQRFENQKEINTLLEKTEGVPN